MLRSSPTISPQLRRTNPKLLKYGIQPDLLISLFFYACLKDLILTITPTVKKSSNPNDT